MFPPETTHTTLPRPARPAIAAATGVAPAPSAITRLRSAAPVAQAAAAIGHHDRLHFRQVLEDLQADRSVSCHHRRIAHRVDEESVEVLVGTVGEDLEPLVKRRLQDDPAETADGGELG